MKPPGEKMGDATDLSCSWHDAEAMIGFLCIVFFRFTPLVFGQERFLLLTAFPLRSAER